MDDSGRYYGTHLWGRTVCDSNLFFQFIFLEFNAYHFTGDTVASISHLASFVLPLVFRRQINGVRL